MSRSTGVLYRRKIQWYRIMIALVIASLVVYWALNKLRANIVYFYTPSSFYQNYVMEQQSLITGDVVRVGGIVKLNSVRQNEYGIYFVITDYQNEIMVNYKGVLPNLFREGQGIVALGMPIDFGVGWRLDATEILAKHDEQYMSNEDYENIKKKYSPINNKGEK